MNKKINIILIIIILIVIGISIFFIYKNSLENNLETPNHEENNNNISKNFILNGKYVVTYNDKTPKDYKANTPSTLIINSDNTFIFNYNACADMQDLNGDYEIIDNKLILSNYKTRNQYEISSVLPETLSFTIISNDEIYLNDFLGCVIDSNDYDKGYGSFKKTE